MAIDWGTIFSNVGEVLYTSIQEYVESFWSEGDFMLLDAIPTEKWTGATLYHRYVTMPAYSFAIEAFSFTGSEPTWSSTPTYKPFASAKYSVTPFMARVAVERSPMIGLMKNTAIGDPEIVKNFYKDLAQVLRNAKRNLEILLCNADQRMGICTIKSGDGTTSTDTLDVGNAVLLFHKGMLIDVYSSDYSATRGSGLRIIDIDRVNGTIKVDSSITPDTGDKICLAGTLISSGSIGMMSLRQITDSSLDYFGTTRDYYLRSIEVDCGGTLTYDLFKRALNLSNRAGRVLVLGAPQSIQKLSDVLNAKSAEIRVPSPTIFDSEDMIKYYIKRYDGTDIEFEPIRVPLMADDESTATDNRLYILRLNDLKIRHNSPKFKWLKHVGQGASEDFWSDVPHWFYDNNSNTFKAQGARILQVYAPKPSMITVLKNFSVDSLTS